MNKTLQRYEIVSAYIHDQTDESWERMKAAIRQLEGEDDELFRAAVEGLTEFHPELADERLVAGIRAKVVIPDTGNPQADYQNVRNQVERLVQQAGHPRRKTEKLCVRKGGLREELYLTRQGAWDQWEKRARFSSQEAAERFVRKHVRGEDWGLFPG